jgi:hypothetical protein
MDALEASARERALAVARRMLAGELPPEEGAQAITNALPDEAPDGLRAAAADWTLCPELRDALAADALAGARELVRRFGAEPPAAG